MPKVSVIIPTFNREQYISDTINSVLSQTFSDYEIIVVDDGSTDNTERMVMERFMDKIIYISKPNGGPSSARNVGLKAAKGKYIAFLDSDDLWLPEKLEIQTRFMDANPDIGLSFTKALSFGANAIGKYEDVEVLYKKIKSPTLKNLLQGNFIPNLTVITQRKCIEDVGGFDERKELIGTEDYELWIRIAMKYTIFFIPRVLARYRIHEGNLWAGASIKKIESDYFTVISCVNGKFPGLIEEIFGDMKSFYAERYRCFGDNIPFFGDTKEKARLYRKSIRWAKPDITVLIELIFCYLILMRNTLKDGK